MIVTKMSLPAPHVLRVSAQVLHSRCSTAWCGAYRIAAVRAAGSPLRRGLRAQRHGHAGVDAERARERGTIS